MGVGYHDIRKEVIAATLGLPAQEVTGYGAGVTEKMKAHKTAVIQKRRLQCAPYSDMIDLVFKVNWAGYVWEWLAPSMCPTSTGSCVIDGLSF